MANTLTPHHPLLKGQQLAAATMNLPREKSNSSTDSPPPAERRHTFGTHAPFPSKSDFRMHAHPSPESEDSSKHTIYPTESESDFYMNALFF
jgi:hypothetical protein